MTRVFKVKERTARESIISDKSYNLIDRILLYSTDYVKRVAQMKYISNKYLCSFTDLSNIYQSCKIRDFKINNYFFKLYVGRNLYVRN